MTKQPTLKTLRKEFEKEQEKLWINPKGYPTEYNGWKDDRVLDPDKVWQWFVGRFEPNGRGEE